ncbi:hypothetical protein RHGRI_012813 [Rhododendron griersonianum]|uniref:Uncharacterized protein n=1 Tax=Rhododendron griersonianum TaxID=479676 RepID=A0AAV6KSJ3_9ERIC|nr:hypothetical protein RHGRI_012813 [Rhododendron griersonianum]
MAVGGNPPRRRLVQPRFLKEEEVSDDVSITKPLAGNHQSMGRTRAVKVVNHDSRLWKSGLKINFSEFQGGMTPKILKVSAGEKKVIEEILVEGDVGDFLDDVLEEEFDKIFFDNNTSSFQSEIDWESPPRFDEYADDEFKICEANFIQDIVHVAIQEDGTVGKIVDGSSNETKFMSLDSCSSIDKSFATWKFSDWIDMGKNLKSDEIEIAWGSQFMDHFWEYIEAAVKKNIWITYLEQIVTNNIDFIFEDSSLQFGVRKINVRYKIDADKLRRIQLYKLEDEFLQDGENDAEQKYDEYKLITHYFVRKFRFSCLLFWQLYISF